MLKSLLVSCSVLLWLSVSSSLTASDRFALAIQPILKDACLTCHSTDQQEGELDLERFVSLATIKAETKVWEGVLEQLANNEMPPKGERQLTVEEKSAFTDWIQQTLDEVALANAGDPGPVILRRLSNMEYTYTLRDLTGVDSLDPTREFPIDGAAGEGFTNAGAALVMSPSLLTKYLDAAKEVASHAMLTPDGFQFSPSTTASDWTNETLQAIRDFYASFADGGGATAVNLQGIQFDTNSGGRLTIEKYLDVLVREREALSAGTSIDAVAARHQVNAKYLTKLLEVLNEPEPSMVIHGIQQLYRQATPDSTQSLIDVVHAWQQSLWRFTSVGHIGKVNGPQAWQEAVDPLVALQELRLPFPLSVDCGDVTIYLSVSDAGDGNTDDFAVWENARIVAPGRTDIPLKHARQAIEQLKRAQETIVSALINCLTAADEVERTLTRTDVAAMADKHDVAPEQLASWLNYLGIGFAGEVQLGPLLTDRMAGTPDYNFVQGWNGADALGVLANSSDIAVRTPGTIQPHSIVTHPSPTRASVIAWKSPINGLLQVSGYVQDAHTDCGNGVTWRLEARRGNTHETLASGTTEGATRYELGPFTDVQVLNGDALALIIGPRDGSHVCDLTAIDLVTHDGVHEWSLAGDVAANILESNPHADRHGHPAVWHFCSEPATSEVAPAIPTDSLLGQWRNTKDSDARQLIAAQLQQLFSEATHPADDTIALSPADQAVVQQVLSLNGPIVGSVWQAIDAPAEHELSAAYGIDPGLFGIHPHADATKTSSSNPLAAVGELNLCVQAPSVLELRLPKSLTEGAELVATGRLDASLGNEGSVQMQLLTTKPTENAGLAASVAETSFASGQWSDNNLRTMHSAPVIVHEGSRARRRVQTAFADFREIFPIALCYTQIVPVDEVVTLTLFYREDEALSRLMLSDEQTAHLDRLWERLHFVSQSPLKQVDGFEQLYQFATQDADPSAFEPMRAPIQQAAEHFKQQVLEAEPVQVAAAIAFAAQAWRRHLTETEATELRNLYHKLRNQDLPHDSAVRMLLTRILVAPNFLYRGEQTEPGLNASRVNNWELATRLSYFLWSTAPDAELQQVAAAGRLHDADVLVAQMQRMVRDAKIRRMATEFGCQWLHVRDVETLDEKSERHFPTFVDVRGDMQEEVVRFFIDLLQEDRSILSLIDADYSFINGPLAAHYGLDMDPQAGWQKVDGLRSQGRGGMLAFAATLSKQSGASRTSPILRGNWLSEVVLGERLPRPPKDVPVLPEEAPQGLTERQLIERHSSDESCAGCHRRIDPFGFALEGYDAIGRLRTIDTAGLPIDTATTLPNGEAFAGIDGLRNYLITTRREDFLRQFCRKLVGYALGRSVQLSDKPLIEAMLAGLEANEYRVTAAIKLIVRSPQFQQARGREHFTNH